MLETPVPTQEKPITPSRIGERAPQRDSVGVTAERKQPPKCPGSGMLDLDARSLTQSAVSQVECQECGSVRTVKFKAESVIFPSHEKLRTRTTQTGSRWVKREAGWILSTRGK